MRYRLLLFIVVFLLLNVILHVEADFFYNHISPKVEELDAASLKCIPGRTVMRIKQKEIPVDPGSGSDDDEYVATDNRRSHMNFPPKDDYCQICVCSVEGKDEYCSRRPAMNVNECMRMATLLDKFHKNVPFEHERSLAFRIRRDYLWHNDEIPYEAKAKCRRGHSYYSSSVNANDTDIDVASDIESLLDYSNKDICYYCVCSMDGRSVGCISRNTYFCEYYREIRENNAARDMYTTLFEQDRPTYFRQLSYRLRRTLDNGMFEFLDSVGSGQEESKKCIPFVSVYTDCTDENQCSGCTKCTCSAQAEWSCDIVDKCSSMMQRAPLSDDDIDSALLILENEMKRDRLKSAASSKNPLVPPPPTPKDLIIVPDEDEKKFSIEDELMDLIRPKRSTDEYISDVKNKTVQFHHTIDEINEDTLKNVNLSGTIEAKKLDVLNKETLSRRTGKFTNKNSSNSLQIEYNKPKLYQDMANSKVETNGQTEDRSHDTLYQLSDNFTEQQKNKDLSKIIVNELNRGIEVIGDKNSPIMSNVTFTPENDTLTAMTFIAGNLLNKLWNIERDSSEAIETEVLKHEKIADLLEIFKEPLTMRQEIFLKNALKQLSTAIDKTKDIGKVSLCDSVEKIKKSNESSYKDKKGHNGVEESIKCAIKNDEEISTKAEAQTKMSNVIDLVKKFEKVKKHVNDLKNKPESKFVFKKLSTKEREDSLNLFGGILEKITKLILPSKRSQKMINNIRNQNMYGASKGVEKVFKEFFNMDVPKLTVNAKDKLVLDYLQHVDSNPDCYSYHKDYSTAEKPKLSVEGNVLLNLSKFFKIKSLNDLVQVISSSTKNISEELSNVRTLETSKKNIDIPITPKSISQNVENPTKTLSNMKEKLKTHLKSILEDIMEMKVVNGQPKEKIEITDILPCIYNILNSNEETKHRKVETSNSFEKVTAIFHNLRNDLKHTQNTRRSNLIHERPKSATVWDRVIKNLNDKHKLSSRRRLKSGNIPKTYEELNKIMDETEYGSKTYKTVALFNEVPAADRLTLLKTFDMDVKKYIDVIEHITTSLAAGKVSRNKFNEITEYLHNVRNNINLNQKVVKSMNRRKPSTLFGDDNIDSKKRKLFNIKLKPNQAFKVAEVTSSYGTNTKITRDQIMNQLIQNRLRLFIKVKEASQSYVSEDINYDIAKKILLYLERGNYVIAREMYKIFISQYQRNIMEDGRPGYSRINENDGARRDAMRNKEPLIQFEQTKVDDVPLMSHEHLLQQLINIKNMNI